MWKDVMKAVLAPLLLCAALLAPVEVDAGGVPLIPSSPTYNEPNQIVSTLNALIEQLNGQPAGSGGYAALGNGVPSLGSFCAGTSATSAITCSGAGPGGGGTRGTLTFSAGITITTTGSTESFTVTDNTITATMVCQAWWASAFTSGSGVAVASVTATANTLSIVAVNAGTTSNAVTTGTLGFNCVS